MTNKILVIVLTFFFFIGKNYGQYCVSENRYTKNAIYTVAQIDSAIDLVYGSAQNSINITTSLKMDMYYPNNAADPGTALRPFILLIHGGGFISGDKQSGDIVDLCRLLAMRGFVTASLGYRLGHDLSEYSQYRARYRAIQDGHAALRYIVNNANTYRIDTNWIFVGGQSAGAVLSLGLVYSDQDELDTLSLLYSSTAISAQLGNLYTSGNNLTNNYSIKGIFNNWGGVIASEVDREEMIPTIAFHGDADTTVLIDADNSFAHSTFNGSRTIHNSLIANNICSELNVVPNGGHGVYRNAETVHRAERASCFFKSLFCNQCASFSTIAKDPATCSSILSSDVNILAPTLKVYPNPIQNSFKIEGYDGVLDIKIHNSIGQLVYNAETYNGEVQVNLLAGIYFLTVRQIESNLIFTTKLIKN